MASRALLFDQEPDPAMHFASLAPVRLGMPELCRAGLSENWLLKACGHRHWLALAEAHGLDRPEFRARDGERLYPAFTHVVLRDCRLEAVREDDLLDFDLRLERTGVTRFAGDIAVSAGSRRIASIRMESVFLQRTITGSNLSVTRMPIARDCALAVPAPGQSSHRASAFAWDRGSSVHRHVIDPNPWEDFNGADFLYFAAFQAIVDRAEWASLAERHALRVTRDREIRFLANIELGDRVEVRLDVSADGCEHHAELRRVSDGGVIARALTRREAIS